MARAVFRGVTLADFRSYGHAALELDGRPVVLFGPNGAGKTNLLEALSYLAPGRGIRGASVAEVGRRQAGETQGRAWSVSARVESADGEVRVGTGIEPGSVRRIVRLDGETVAPGRLAQAVRLVWLTPAQDPLFQGAGSERRRFLDRLVFSAEPAHAAHVAAYDKAMRERLRLLTETTAPPDPLWLDALEARAGEAGARVAEARVRTVQALQVEIDRRADRPFPMASISLTGEWGREESIEAAELSAALARARGRDAAAGRGLTGPHRTDLLVVHREKGRPAAECSTGEQKALILNLILAQAQRLARAESAPNPILLLDEVAAHLDADRRAALFDEITALGLQAFLTGADRALFEPLAARADMVRVDVSGLTARL